MIRKDRSFLLMLFSSESASALAKAIPSLRGKFDENNVFAYALYVTPRDAQILRASKSKEASAPSDDQCRYLCAIPLCLKLKIRCIPKLCTVAGVDDLQAAELRSTVPFHILTSRFLLKRMQKVSKSFIGSFFLEESASKKLQSINKGSKQFHLQRSIRQAPFVQKYLAKRKKAKQSLKSAATEAAD